MHSPNKANRHRYRRRCCWFSSLFFLYLSLSNVQQHTKKKRMCASCRPPHSAWFGWLVAHPAIQLSSIPTIRCPILRPGRNGINIRVRGICIITRTRLTTTFGFGVYIFIRACFSVSNRQLIDCNLFVKTRTCGWALLCFFMRLLLNMDFNCTAAGSGLGGRCLMGNPRRSRNRLFKKYIYDKLWHFSRKSFFL